MDYQESAFPTYIHVETARGGAISTQPGMSKREYYAACILPEIWKTEYSSPEKIAKIAFKVADAMIAEGSKPSYE